MCVLGQSQDNNKLKLWAQVKDSSLPHTLNNNQKTEGSQIKWLNPLENDCIVISIAQLSHALHYILQVSGKSFL